MALKPAPKRYWWYRFHFLLRLAGLTGLLAAGIGVALFVLDRGVSAATWETLGHHLRDAAVNIVHGNLGEIPVSIWLALAGATALVIALIVEAFTGVRFAAARRGVFGTNAMVQIALAIALLIGVNIFSFEHYKRLDWTRDRQFTLAEHISPDLLARLKKLKSTEPTTIVVFQRSKTFGQLSDKPDVYDYAASPLVVEKIKDLVEQFRELGKQFRVIVLDVEEEGYDRKMKQIETDSKKLADAIHRAPENSVFFYANDKVQRLGFHDLYQLDKKTSQEADGGKGNLVLVGQGVDPFARKILDIEEKKPVIAVAVVHEALGSEGDSEGFEDYGMPGLRKVLTERGFEVRDIILKKWSEFGPPEPAVLTSDENKFERIDAQLTELNDAIKQNESVVEELKRQLKEFQTETLDNLTKKYARAMQVPRVDERIRQGYIRALQERVPIIQAVFINPNKEDRDALLKEKSGLKVENIQEQRRITDVRAKTARMLADCDMLILPRMTIRNVLIPESNIPERIYRLDDGQVDAIKDFMKAGKPVLACFGPTNRTPDTPPDPESLKPDKLEDLFSQLGFKLAKQTVLFNSETKSFGERRAGLLGFGASVEVPPVVFDWKPGDGLPVSLKVTHSAPKAANPIGESLRLAARGLSQEQPLDIRLHYPRPIYFERDGTAPPSTDPVFMMTDEAAWNAEQPFPTRQGGPKFEPPKQTDASKGTLDERRQGRFPIGVAVQTKVPAGWYTTGQDAHPANVRVAVIGHGGLFTGRALSPAKEKLLLDVSNWLLGRDDLLSKDQVWIDTPQGTQARDENRVTFERVNLDDRRKSLWQWGAWVGLPILFLYLGLAVFMVRRLR